MKTSIFPLLRRADFFFFSILSIWSFYTGYVYSDFMFFFDRLEIILGGEGGYLDWFCIRLLARDPPSEVGSMQR